LKSREKNTKKAPSEVADPAASEPRSPHRRVFMTTPS